MVEIESIGRFVAFVARITIYCACVGVASAQLTTNGTTPQQRAVRLFPDLAIPSSKLNQEFVRRYKFYQTENPTYFNNPEWSTQLARESAGADAMSKVRPDDGAGYKLSPADILKRAQEKYASLKSYSDEGKIVASMNGATITTTFAIRLARPRLYRIEWEQSTDTASSTPNAKARAVWSAGGGDFLENESGTQKRASPESALSAATGISGGAASTVPGTFFAMVWGDQLVGSAVGKKQETDQKVGEVDYVLTWEVRQQEPSTLKGTARTLWIGRQDFLIHQMRNVMSAEVLNAVREQAAKSRPNNRCPTTDAPRHHDDGDSYEHHYESDTTAEF
jgi:hypothetical protein